MNKIFILLPVFLLMFSACSPTEKPVESAQSCTAVTQSLVAELPAETVDLKNPLPFANSGEALTIRTVGTYVGEHTLLTVAHALPPTAQIAGMSEVKRDETSHLLLLNSDTCGKALQVATSDLSAGQEIYDCKSGNTMGKISGFEASAFTASPFSSAAVLLNDLAVLPGTFVEGDSGEPFCDQKGNLIGILAAIRESKALLIPAERIRPFLN